MASSHSIQRKTVPTTPARDTASGPTWTPVVYFSDGRVKRFPGGLSHSEALSAAASECSALDDAESFAAQRDGLRPLKARVLTDQELIWGIVMGPNDKIIRLPQVLEKVGLKKSAIYKKIKLGEFPPPIKLGAHASGWLESEVIAWIDKLARQRQA